MYNVKCHLFPGGFIFQHFLPCCAVACYRCYHRYVCMYVLYFISPIPEYIIISYYEKYIKRSCKFYSYQEMQSIIFSGNRFRFGILKRTSEFALGAFSSGGERTFKFFVITCFAEKERFQILDPMSLSPGLFIGEKGGA